MNIPNREIAGLDALAETVWPPRMVQHVGGWRCHLDKGRTRRANSVLASGDDGSGIDARFVEVESIYRATGLRPCFQITPASTPDGLDPLLEARGYRKEGKSNVMVAPHIGFASGTERTSVILRRESDDDWWATFLPSASDAVVKAYRDIIERISLPTTHASLRVDGQTQSVGMAAAGSDWGWVNCMRTRTEYRRQGGAKAVLTALTHWCLVQGATNLFLQVEVANAAAIALYQGAGFQIHYDYHYRVLA